MPALVESMFYTSNIENGRFVPWHGLGTPVEEAPNSEQALILAGLDWEVIQKSISTDTGIIPNYKANVRSDTNEVLGVVTDRYAVVQNKEAFDFTDALIADNDVRYETAGSLRNGKTIWLLAKLPERKILDDTFDPYICFSNTHDGTGAIRVCMTPIRVVCANTLNLALSDAHRSWSVRHIGDMNAKLSEAQDTLLRANSYMNVLDKEANILVNASISNAQVNEILDELFVLPADASQRLINNANLAKQDIKVRMQASDIKKYAGTKYALINAVTDFVGHAAPGRITSDYDANRWSRIMNGDVRVDKAYSLIKAA